jgi:hypothetical protein
LILIDATEAIFREIVTFKLDLLADVKDVDETEENEVWNLFYKRLLSIFHYFVLVLVSRPTFKAHMLLES